MTMRFEAEPVKGKDLKPGDLFSTASQFYWDHRDPSALGEKVYVRTEAPTPPEQAEDDIFRIAIVR